MMEATSTPSILNPITAVGGPVPVTDEHRSSGIGHEVSSLPGDKKQEVYRVATELFRQDPDWVTFFREVLGIDGVARRLFASKEELAALEHTDEYSEIQQMLAKLRARSVPPPNEAEPTRVITVRLPKIRRSPV